ncbi:MAG: hypothetical protein ACYC8T_18280 [Myxococcaceae bacterium]
MQTSKNPMKTFPIPQHLPGNDPTLPTGVWDPLWQKPEVARRIAGDVYRDLRLAMPEFPTLELTPAGKLTRFAPENTDERSFDLSDAVKVPDSSLRLRGSSCGEIFREYPAGPNKPKQYFHAQAVVFGLDSEGRYFLRGIVGRLAGNDMGNKATLELRFLDKAGKVLGGKIWRGQLDLQPETQVLIAGKSEALRAGFDGVHSALLSFETRPAA